ncbi:hypothetical protein EYF80_021405 [Liparis tanakae]|uniref:Uncharacterized protein n=1 Tax=Liparis tanakae TaxID=230148 RepID=A0A4Z2HTZ6_9TELE|nr:hypothetical protein EYF80_021405 [Liparis tanakae]
MVLRQSHPEVAQLELSYFIKTHHLDGDSVVHTAFTTVDIREEPRTGRKTALEGLDGTIFFSEFIRSAFTVAAEQLELLLRNAWTQGEH